MQPAPRPSPLSAELPTPVLVTGASGFIGGRLVGALGDAGIVPRLLLRRPPPAGGLPAWRGARADILTGDLSDAAALTRACQGIGCIFHCAGFAHALDADSAALAEQHQRINRDATLRLADAAITAGVPRLVFLSSTKALGEDPRATISDDWPGQPADPYGRAKREAEAGLLARAAEGRLDVRIARPAMVYGRGGRGNLARMADAIRRGRFPPLPETGNRRALVHVDDVVDVLLALATHPAARNRAFIVADAHPHSGRQLYDALRDALGLPPLHWAVPAGVLRALARLGDGLSRGLGLPAPLTSEMLGRLLDSADYTPRAILGALGWQSRVTLAEGLREMLGRGSPS